MVVRDVMWVWGNPEMAEEGAHTHKTFAQAGPAERAQLLGVPNIVMAGHGLSRDDGLAEDLAKQRPLESGRRVELGRLRRHASLLERE